MSSSSNFDPRRAEFEKQIEKWSKRLEDRNITNEQIGELGNEIIKAVNKRPTNLDEVSFHQIQALRDRLKGRGVDVTKLDATIKHIAQTALLSGVVDVSGKILAYSETGELLNNLGTISKELRPVAIQKAIDLINANKTPLYLLDLSSEKLAGFIEKYGKSIECLNLGGILLLDKQFFAKFPLSQILVWCPNIKELNLTSCRLSLAQIQDVVSALRNLPNCKSLSLNQNRMSSEGILTLRDLSNLEELGLGDIFPPGEIDDIRVNSITEVLLRMPKLKKLDLRDIFIGRAGHGAFSSFADALGTLSSLEVLSLRSTAIGRSDEEVEKQKTVALAEALKKLKKLNELDLSYNPIRIFDDLAPAISQMKQLKTFIYFGVLNVEISPEDVQKLIRALGSCPLENLVLRWNNFRQDPNILAELGRLLEKFPHLRELDLSETNIGQGFNGLAESIGTLKNLEFLYLRNNSLDSTHEATLIELAKKLKKAKNIELGRYPLSLDQITQMNDTLGRKSRPFIQFIQ